MTNENIQQKRRLIMPILHLAVAIQQVPTKIMDQTVQRNAAQMLKLLL